MFLNSDYSKEILLAIDEMPIKELYVKLELLDWQENTIRDIQGTLTGGTVSINGDSSIRRVCNLSFIITDDNGIEDYISLNSKFRLFIGLKNRLPLNIYQQVDENILWFKMGVYVFCTASFSKNNSGTKVNVTAKDKGCLLNGDIAGTIPDTIALHEVELEDKDGSIYYEQILLFNIIQELVHHYGGEKMSNIYISDIPEKIRQLMVYNGSRPIYLELSEQDNGAYTANYNWSEFEGSQEIVAGDPIGYILTDFIYPGELIAKPGDTVAGMLDKIKNVLGNFEYFYDIDGHFRFQEIRNYLNNSFVPMEGGNNISGIMEPDYLANFDMEEIIYSFKDNKKLISALNNNPNYSNIKNDFVVWGVRKTINGNELPVRFHLAIDGKPVPVNEEDWRETLYQYCLAGEDKDEEGLDYYTKEMIAEWRKLYDGNNWNESVINDPMSLDFFIDFIDDSSYYGEYSVNKIGRRTYAEVNSDCTCVFAKQVPDIIFVETVQEQDELNLTGEFKCVSVAQPDLMNSLKVSSSINSCFDRVRELIYQHLTLNESITISALPIYWLEPNCKIEVEDDSSRIYGQYMIKSISIPLTYNGTMNIQATRALSRL